MYILLSDGHWPTKNNSWRAEWPRIGRDGWESIINTALNNSFKFNIALKSFRQGLSKGLSNFAQLSDHYIWARGTKFEFSIPSFNPHWLVTFSLSVPAPLQWRRIKWAAILFISNYRHCVSPSRCVGLRILCYNPFNLAQVHWSHTQIYNLQAFQLI